MQFDLKYSQEQKKTFKSSLIDNGMLSAQEMDERQKEAKKYQDVNDIHAKINLQNAPFAYGGKKGNQ